MFAAERTRAAAGGSGVFAHCYQSEGESQPWLSHNACLIAVNRFYRPLRDGKKCRCSSGAIALPCGYLQHTPEVRAVEESFSMNSVTSIQILHFFLFLTTPQN